MREHKHPLQAVSEMEAFLASHPFSEPVVWGREERAEFIGEVLSVVGYERLPREEKGVVRQYLQVASGYSRAQVARTIAMHRQKALVETVQMGVKMALPKSVIPAGLVACLLLLMTSASFRSPEAALQFLNGDSINVWNMSKKFADSLPMNRSLMASLNKVETVMPDGTRGDLFVVQKEVWPEGYHRLAESHMVAETPEKLEEKVENRRETRLQNLWARLIGKDLEANVEQRRQERLLVQDESGQIHAAAEPGVITQTMTVSGGPVNIWDLLGSGREGEVLMVKDGKPGWGSPALPTVGNPELGAGRVPPTVSRGGGGSGGERSYGGGNTESTTTTTTTNITQTVGDNDWTISGNNIYSAVSGNVGIGTSVPSVKLEVSGTASGLILHAQDQLTTSGAFIVEEGQTMRINGVTYTFPASDGTASGKVLKTDSNGQLSWATDSNTGGTSSFSTGNVLTIFGTDANPRYVQIAGDTMTGALVIQGAALTASGVTVTSNLAASGSLSVDGLTYLNSTTTINDSLFVRGNMSGSTLRVDGYSDLWGNLSVSGALVIDGAATFGSTLSLNSVTYTFPYSDGSSSGWVLKTDSSGQLSWGEDTGGITETLADDRYVNQSGDTMTGALVIINEGSEPSLNVVGTMSGTSLYVSGTGSSPLIFIDQTTGRVGIGTGTPGAKLEVKDSIGGELRLTTSDTSVDGGDAIGIISFQAPDETSSPGDAATSVVAEIRAIAESGFSSAAAPTALSFWTMDSSDSFGRRMTIDNAGDVGIGTRLPDRKLEINTGEADNGLRFSFNDSNGSATNYTDILTGADGDLTITTVDSNGAVGHIALIPDGNVGIGTTDPSTALEVVGTASGRILHAQDRLTSSGTLSVEGAAYFGSTLELNGVTYTFPSSDGASSGKVLATDGAGQLSWAADTDTDTDTQSSTGALQTVFDNRYVRTAGDTMTGALNIINEGSEPSLNVAGTMSGRLLYITGTGSVPLLFAQNGRVGIGTASPSANLSIYQDSPAVNQTLFRIGTSDSANRFTVDEDGDVRAEGGGEFYQNVYMHTTKLFYLDDGYDTYFSEVSADNIQFTTGGTERLRINNTGIGIGTSPSTKLEVVGTASGRILHAQDRLTSSGTLSVEGAAYFGSTLELNGVTYTFPSSDGAASGKVLATDGAGQLTWATDAGTSYTAGQGLTLNGTVLSLSNTFSGTSLEVSGVSSGWTLHAQDLLTSSGVLSVDGLTYLNSNTAIAGVLAVTSNISGSGTLSIQGASSLQGAVTLGSTVAINGVTYTFPYSDGSASGWVLATDSSGQLSWVADTDTDTQSSTGALQTVFDNRYVRTAGDTMTGALIISDESGAQAGLEVLGTASGRNLFFADLLSGSGTVKIQNTTDSTTSFQILDADGGTPIFNVDTTNERVGIGTAGPSQLLHLASTSSAKILIDADTDNVTETDNAQVLFQQDGGATSATVGLNSSNEFIFSVGGAASEFVFNDGIQLINSQVKLSVPTTNALRVQSSGLLELQGDTNNNDTIAMQISGGDSVAVTVQSDGNVGIDTSTPGSRLSVSGSVIIGDNLGSSAADAGLGLEIIGTASGRILHAQDRLTSSGTLSVEGAAYFGSTLELNGVTYTFPYSDGAASGKVLATDGAGQLTWATDQNTGGLSQADNDSRYVQISGDTMTGDLVLQSANLIASGATITSNLAASGSLSVDGLVYLNNNTSITGTLDATGNITTAGTFSGANLTIMAGADSYILGNVGIGTTSPSTALEVIGTASGRILHAQDLLTSSGVLSVDGNADIQGTLSGAILVISSNSAFSNSNIIFTNTGAAVFNDLGNDVDFRIEGDTDTDLFYVDASADKVGIGTNAPFATLQIKGADEAESGTESPNGILGLSAVGGTQLLTMGTFGTTPHTWIQSRHLSLANTFYSLALNPSGGNVGIGIISPDAKLDVLGTMSGRRLFVRPVIASETGAVFVDVDITSTGVLIDSESLTTPGLVIDMHLNNAQASPHIMLGYDGTFDVILARSGANVLTSPDQFKLTATAAFDNESILIDTEETVGTQNVFRIISDVASGEDNAFRIQANGATFSDNAYSSAGADYAEWFFTGNKDLRPGELVCIDLTRENAVKRCDNAADSNLIGIVSTNPAFVGNTVGGADGVMDFVMDGIPVPGFTLVGLIGQVPAKVMVEEGMSIRPGDALTAASKPGFARRARPGEPTVGVALEGLEGAEGMVNVLISRRNSSLTVEIVEEHVLETVAAMEIEDEVQLMVSQAVNNLDAEQLVNLIATYSGSTILNESQFEEVLDVEGGSLSVRTVLRALANVFVSESLSVLGPANFDKLVTAVGGIVTTDLTLSGSFTANGSVLFLDDILVEGALNAESINVEHDAMIGGLLSASMLEVEDGALIKGGLSIEGELIVNGQSITDAAFKPDAESKIDLGQLIIHDTLFVLGDVTIEGVTKFLGAVDIEGELSVNKNQAGLAMIPKTGTEVTVEFDPPFINMPVVTASSDSFDPWRLAFRSQTGFILQVKDPAEENIMFTWTALTVKDLQVVAGHMGDGTEVIEFPVDQYGVPFSSNEAWNGCIRGQPLLDSDGKPYSCSRYHDDDTWEHPDLLVEFRWNTEKTPRLVLPEGYRVISETRNEEDSEDLEDAEETTSTQEPRPASPESAAADGGGSGGTDENVTTGSGSDFSENGSSIVPSDEPETGSGTLVQEEDDTGSGSAREPLAEEEPEAGTGSSVTQEPEVTEEVPEEIQESEEAVRDPERDLSSEEVVPEDAPVDNEESPLESQEVVFTEEDNLVETTESLAE